MQAENQHVDIFDYSWGNFDDHVMDIQDLVPVSKFKTIVGVAKGGLPLAVKLSNAYNIPMKVIAVKSYVDKKHVGLMVEDFNCEDWPGPILLVDDIVDTGLTFARLSTDLRLRGKDITTLALCYKDRSIHEPDYYLVNVDDQMWVNFPWE